MKRLVIRPGAIGDIILSLPAMEALRTEYTEVWTPGLTVPLVRFAQRTRAISSTGLDLLGLPGIEPPPGLLRDLGQFDSIVSWYGANRTEFQESVRNVPFPFEFHAALPPPGGDVHAADFFLSQVAGNHGQPALPLIPVPCGSCDGGAILHPFSGSRMKNWPLDRYQALAQHLAPKMPVAWCAGPHDDGLPGAIRLDNLYDLASRLARARLYVGNDSGIAHLAAAVGTPTVTLFGPTDPGVWAPRGPSARVVRARNGGTMDGITLEMVIKAVETL